MQGQKPPTEGRGRTRDRNHPLKGAAEQGSAPTLTPLDAGTETTH
ncbi:hypothetical protein T10_739 [Trichinella papuae]|uniref:Uncharacterized protein n=1 Tax=Trichinella papuae TaxID=268474 RepID=A0A0V1LVN3_9BILA|nr:hypothetical protein T10_739 [Trichinella papuae]